MGDYAQDEIDKGIDQLAIGCDCSFYNPRKNCNKEKIIDDDLNENIYTEFSQFEFKKIVKETDKSWVLQMSGDAIQHYSKKYCEIRGNMIIAPKWLLRKIAKWD